MAKEGKETPPTAKTRLVLCPECDTEVDLEKVDECPKCGLDVEAVMRRHRYNRALRVVEDREKKESVPAKKKKSDFDPFD